MQLKSQLESILFISSRVLKKSTLKDVLGCEKDELEIAINNLKDDYAQRQSGVALMIDADRIQLITAPENGELIKKYLKDERSGELSRPSLEALTIIAYRGPITKAEIEMIRGVNCSLILRNLLIRGLIVERSDPKKGVPVYQLTFEFMRYLGIKELNELPDYQKLREDIKLEEILKTQPQNKEDFFQNVE